MLKFSNTEATDLYNRILNNRNEDSSPTLVKATYPSLPHPSPQPHLLLYCNLQQALSQLLHLYPLDPSTAHHLLRFPVRLSHQLINAITHILALIMARGRQASPCSTDDQKHQPPSAPSLDDFSVYAGASMISLQGSSTSKTICPSKNRGFNL